MHHHPESPDEQSLLLPTITTLDNKSTTTTSSGNHQQQWQGRSWLLFVALLYGTLNVTLRAIYAQPSPPSAAALSASRGWLAVLCFLPLVGWSRQRTRTRRMNSKDGSTTATTKIQQQQALELAIWNFGAQGLANIGLLTVPSARAAFLTQTSVIWTPFLSWWLLQQPPQRRQWCASLLCVCGLGVLSWSSSSSSSSTNTNGITTTTGHSFGTPGDVCLLLAAGCWSMYILRLSLFSSSLKEENDNDGIPLSLQAYKNVYLACLYSLWWWMQSMGWWVDATSSSSQEKDSSSYWYHHSVIWWLLLYSAVGPGTLADIWQQQGQSLLSFSSLDDDLTNKKTTTTTTNAATESNVLLSLEPVFTAVLGWVCLHEPLSRAELCGGVLVISAALWASIGEKRE